MGIPQASSLGTLSHWERDCDLESQKPLFPFLLDWEQTSLHLSSTAYTSKALP